jgi:hypothetical protein
MNLLAVNLNILQYWMQLVHDVMDGGVTFAVNAERSQVSAPVVYYVAEQTRPFYFRSLLSIMLQNDDL